MIKLFSSRRLFLVTGLIIGACAPQDLGTSSPGSGGTGTGGGKTSPGTGGMAASTGSGGSGTGGALSTGGVSSGGTGAGSGGAAAVGSGGAATGGASAASGGNASGGMIGNAGGGVSTGGGNGQVGGQAGSSNTGAGASNIVVQDPGNAGDGDFTINSPFTAQPEVSGTGAPHGKSYAFTMRSQDSKIYNGTDSTLLAANQHSFTRQVSVYIPKQYVNGAEGAFTVVLDGGAYTGGTAETITLVDNLMNAATPAQRIPTMILIFVANGGGDSYGSERGLEYDTMSDRFARFIDTEVLPAVVNNSAVKADYPKLNLTTNPEGRGVYGCSSGGAAAFTMGWFTLNYRRIITYSGTFVDQQDSDAAEEKMYPGGAWDYHEFVIKNSPPKPLRVFLEVGSKDNGSTMDVASMHNWVIANQRMAAVLKAQGYHYRFVYANGAGHGDNGARKATVADTFRWTWRGYPLN